MKKLRFYAGKVSEKLGIAPETVSGVHKITMLGNDGLLIENHKGIIEYSPNNIRISIESGILCIEGTDLFLDVMDHDMVSISGRIHNIMKLDGGSR